MIAFAVPSALRYVQTLTTTAPLCSTTALPLRQHHRLPFSLQPIRYATTAKASENPPRRRMPAVLRPVVPTSDLFTFNVEDKAQFRFDIVRLVNSYVKEKNLQDPSNKRIILCDEKLKKLFGVDTCTHFEINGLISPYLNKPEEIGGRYVEEGKKLEQLYIEQKGAEGPNVSNKKRSKKKSAAPRTFKPVILSSELATICRSKEMPRPDVLKAVWAYIRLNNLQSGPGQPIKCDFLLKKISGTDQLDPRGVMKVISAHMSNKQ